MDRLLHFPCDMTVFCTHIWVFACNWMSKQYQSDYLQINAHAFGGCQQEVFLLCALPVWKLRCIIAFSPTAFWLRDAQLYASFLLQSFKVSLTQHCSANPIPPNWNHIYCQQLSICTGLQMFYHTTCMSIYMYILPVIHVHVMEGIIENA